MSEIIYDEDKLLEYLSDYVSDIIDDGYDVNTLKIKLVHACAYYLSDGFFYLEDAAYKIATEFVPTNMVYIVQWGRNIRNEIN